MAPQSTPQFFLSRWNSEMPAFLKVIRALPAEQLHYKPHERSTGAGDLAWQLAVEAQALTRLAETGEIRWKQDARPSSPDDVAAEFEKAAKAVSDHVGKLDASKWEGPAKFYMGGDNAWETTMEDMFWGFLFDMVHHRGQLSTYIRPMGGKVPSIYGPSADDMGG